jgi:hypothetical protein
MSSRLMYNGVVQGIAGSWRSRRRRGLMSLVAWTNSAASYHDEAGRCELQPGNTVHILSRLAIQRGNSHANLQIE